MRKLSLIILLLLPLITFGQGEKHYRSIIVDSLKALNGGRVDVKDTLLLDSLAVYNTDLSSQYTSRSLVDSAFVGVAVSSGGGNTIYSGDDNLAGNRTVTMGANSLTFSGNITTFQGIDATNANSAFLIEDNTGTDLFTVLNDGYVVTNTDGAATFGTRTAGVIAKHSFTAGLSNNATNVAANASSFALGTGNIVPGLFAGALNAGNTSSGRSSLAINEGNTASGDNSFSGGQGSVASGVSSFSFGRQNVTTTNLGGLSFGQDINNTGVTAHVIGAGANGTTGRLVNVGNLSFVIAYDSDVPTFFVGTATGLGTHGKVGIGMSSPTATLNIRGEDATSGNDALLVEDNVGTDLVTVQNDGHLISGGEFSTTKKDLTLGIAAVTFITTSNVMQITGDGGGNTLATITGALSGQYLIMIFVDDKVTITDDNGHGANTIDLSAAFSSLDDTVLHLIYDGTSWYETSRSVN